MKSSEKINYDTLFPQLDSLEIQDDFLFDPETNSVQFIQNSVQVEPENLVRLDQLTIGSIELPLHS